MVGQNLVSLSIHLQEKVHSCKSYLFLPVLPLVQLPLLQLSLEAPPTAALSFRRAVEEGSRTGERRGLVSEIRGEEEQGRDH